MYDLVASRGEVADCNQLNPLQATSPHPSLSNDKGEARVAYEVPYTVLWVVVVIG